MIPRPPRSTLFPTALFPSQYFKATKDLLTKLQESYPNYQLTELSMGMTHDFPIAVAEGSTMVRLGHALFDE